MKRWVTEIDRNCDNDVQRILVGNKSDDTERRQIPYSEGKLFAERMGIPFIEASAKENLNVEEIFETITRKIMENIEQKLDPGEQGIDLTQTATDEINSPKQHRKKCCKSL